MAVEAPTPRKAAFTDRFVRMMKDHGTVVTVVADNVGSRQMAGIRYSLRGKATILMGKKTTMKKIIAMNKQEIPHASVIAPHLRENVGMIFCQGEPEEIKQIIENNKVPAPARQGVIAPSDVFVEPGPTGMDPTQTSFFQAMGISTKIVKGQIEIQTQVHLIKAGEKVSASAATLLQKLHVRPFFYGLKISKIYQDGNIYDASVLDITDEYIRSVVTKGVGNIAALSLAVGFPTQPAAKHLLTRGITNAYALSLGADYKLPQLEFSSSPAAAEPQAPSVSEAAKAPEPQEEESEDDMGFSLFG